MSSISRHSLSRIKFFSRRFAESFAAPWINISRRMATDSPKFDRIDPSLLVEEERLPGYKPERYYPVHVGQVFNERYKTIGTVGAGTASTVWLCRDLQKADNWVALKVYVNTSKADRELLVYEHINNLRSTHDGKDNVRKLLDSFEIDGPHGTHICLVHEPLGANFGEIRDVDDDKVLPAALIRLWFRKIHRGLEFLHQEAKVIHTGKLVLMSMA